MVSHVARAETHYVLLGEIIIIIMGSNDTQILLQMVVSDGT